MISKEQFIKNNLLVFSNKIISKVITFGIMVILTRQLSSNDFGNLTILITLSSVFGAFQDLGSNFIVVRETAKDHQSAKKILVNTLFLKVISGIICYLFLVMFVNFMGYSQVIVRLSYVFAFGMLAESFLLTLIKHYEGKEAMKYSSTIIIAERILIALFIFVFSIKIPTIEAYGVSYILSNGILFIIGFIVTIKMVNIEGVLEFKFAKKLFFATRVFIIFIIFSTILSRLDVFIINYYQNEAKVATYRACYQIIESIYFIPMNLSISLLPFFSRQFRESPEKLKAIYPTIFRQVIIIAFFVCVSIFVGSGFVLKLLYNKYLDGSLLFSILALSIPFYFINSINGNLLIALSKEKSVTIALIISSVVKVILLVILIKLYGIEGAALSVTITEIVSFILQFLPVYKSGFRLKMYKEDLISLLGIIIYGGLIYFFKNIFLISALSLVIGLWSSRNIIFFVRQNLFARR